MADIKRYKEMLIPLLVLAFITGLLILSGGCGCNKGFILDNQCSVEPALATRASVSPSVIEVYHFHPAQQCYSCQLLGELAEEAINTSFAQEQADGCVIFAHINAELPENADLVFRYGVISSSLMIGYTNETGFHAKNQIGLGINSGIKQIL